MQRPKVSVISVFYNREDTVEESVKSLVEQSYPNLDIILIDDNSKDDTLSKLKLFEHDYPNVRIIHNVPNKGFTQSLIDTINQLDSKYIAIHGSGDLSLSKRIEKQVDFLESHPDAGVVTVGVTNRPGNNVFNVVREITLDDLLKRNMVNHGAVMYRRDKYLEAGGYRALFKTRQDKDLWFRMVLITKIYFLPDKLYTWVKQESSVSNNSFENPQPFLLSELAKFSIELEMNQELSYLAKDEKTMLLLFNPKRCLKLFYNGLFYNLAKQQYNRALHNIRLIRLIEDRFWRKIGLSLIKAYVEFRRER